MHGGAVWVNPMGISRSTALEIVRYDNRYLGVMAISASRARGLAASAGGGVDGPERGGIGAGFWSHYHSRAFRNTHIWFVG